MTKAQRADLVWKTLFVDNTPLSEAARGIISVLDAFGLDAQSANLAEARAFFRSRDLKEHCDWVLDKAAVTRVVMTNDPLNDHEAWIWKGGTTPDKRFNASLRLDVLLNH